jgi:hypothetical protein
MQDLTKELELAGALSYRLVQRTRSGDTPYDAPDVYEICRQEKRFLSTSGRGAYPHTYTDVEVVRFFISCAAWPNEYSNEHVQSLLEAHGQIRTKRDRRTPSLQRFSK